MQINEKPTDGNDTNRRSRESNSPMQAHLSKTWPKKLIHFGNHSNVNVDHVLASVSYKPTSGERGDVKSYFLFLKALGQKPLNYLKEAFSKNLSKRTAVEIIFP